ncbi:hypothetical protein Pmgp_00191 [Pelotomaculum propionicicum]|uniref:Uncharacterized protein n=1 Tax=Pelotomaculum propionicicum TaxID=258475 RepID=A0A4Y7RY66_9FIRM|nr:hypothetical protein [Bacteroidales bacterium]TEB13783.1 hypothetical protein Pmgp_00191 [Pelotomaculum propionicicum]
MTNLGGSSFYGRVKANECCMEIFDGPAKLVEHIRKNNNAVLSANDIDKWHFTTAIA